MNHALLAILHPEQIEVEFWRADELEVRRGLSSELDEMWSFVQAKAHPRWLWHAIDHHTGKVLAACGWQINTAFIERINLSLRQHVAAIGRRVTTLCKYEDGLRQQLALYHVYYNFCLPHASLRIPFALPEPTHSTGSAKRWQPRTPAMAAGLTEHVWTLREVLLGVYTEYV